MKSSKILVFFLLSAVLVLTEQAAVEANSSSTAAPIEARKRDLYYTDQILVLRQFSKKNDSQLSGCEIQRYYDPVELKKILKETEEEAAIEAKHVSYEQLKNLTKECDALDNTVSPPKPGEKVVATKWCGYDGPAESYHDLGETQITDRCCRAHSLCPIVVKSQDTRYNLTNKDPIFPRLLCSCEQEFKDCLLESSLLGNWITFTYFNQITECIAGNPDAEQLKFDKIKHE